MLPARIPEAMPTEASTTIHATLRYSSKRPRLMAVSCGVSVGVCVFILVKENITFVTAVKSVLNLFLNLLLSLQDRISIAIFVQAVRARPISTYVLPQPRCPYQHYIK
jgi:hypothetical protein